MQYLGVTLHGCGGIEVVRDFTRGLGNLRVTLEGVEWRRRGLHIRGVFPCGRLVRVVRHWVRTRVRSVLRLFPCQFHRFAETPPRQRVAQVDRSPPAVAVFGEERQLPPWRIRDRRSADGLRFPVLATAPPRFRQHRRLVLPQQRIALEFLKNSLPQVQNELLREVVLHDERVPQELRGSRSQVRIHSQTASDEVEGDRRPRREELVQGLAGLFGGLLQALERRVPRDQLLVLLRQLPHHLHDLKELVDVRISREERVPGHDLREETPDRPDVDLPPVLRIPHEQLRRPVPPRRDVVRVNLSVGREQSGETEIAEFDHSQTRHQNVLRLDVAMYNIVLMAKLRPPDYLKDVFPALVLPEAALDRFQLVEQSVVKVFEDQVKPPFPPEDLDHVHEVLVPQLLQHPDLPQSHFPHRQVLFGLDELLDGHQLAGLPVPALHHQPVRAFADDSDAFILFHQQMSSPAFQVSFNLICKKKGKIVTRVQPSFELATFHKKWYYWCRAADMSDTWRSLPEGGLTDRNVLLLAVSLPKTGRNGGRENETRNGFRSLLISCEMSIVQPSFYHLTLIWLLFLFFGGKKKEGRKVPAFFFLILWSILMSREGIIGMRG